MEDQISKIESSKGLLIKSTFFLMHLKKTMGNGLTYLLVCLGLGTFEIHGDFF